VYDLGKTVYAGVGAPGAMNFYRLIGNCRKGRLKSLLYGDHFACRLGLPAIKGTAIVLDPTGDATAGGYRLRR
jgi:hypothetical protein